MSPALIDDRRGAVAVIGALSLTMLIGAAALACDLGNYYAERAELQQAGDSAALAGAMAYEATSSSSAALSTIDDVVQLNGWSTGLIQGSGTGYLAQSPQDPSAAAIQVTLTETMPTHLINIVSKITGLTVSVSSVVDITGSGSPVCVLSLSTIIVDSHTTINLGACGMAANSSASPAITVNSSGSLTASLVSTPGTITDNGSINGTTQAKAPAVSDPFSSAQSAASGGFTGCQSAPNNATTLAPGCWSNVTVNSTLTLSQGTYYFSGSMNINSGGSVVAPNGTTVVVQSNLADGGNLTMTAPNTGSFDGVALLVLGNLNINSGVSFAVNGAIYVPNDPLNVDSASWNQGCCTALDAQSITFNSSSSFTLPQDNCASYGFKTASASGGPTSVALRQ